jgi:uncharacterized protein
MDLGKHPRVDHFVFDAEQVLDPAVEARFDSLFRAHEALMGNEIALVTTVSLHGHPDMASYASAYGDSIGVGKKGRDNGVVITYSRGLRSMFVATGLGTEKVLSNAQCQLIVDSVMIPLFKKDMTVEGLWQGSLAIVRHLEQPGNRIP